MRIGIGISVDRNLGSDATPLTLFGTSVALWLRANSTDITIATGVSAWADRSGNGNHVAQGTGALQPAYIASGINGKPVVRFVAASGTVLTKATSTIVPGGPHSIFVVAKWNSFAGAFNGLVGVGAATSTTVGNKTDIGTAWFGGGGFTTPATASALALSTVYRIGKTSTNAVATQGYVNGAASGSPVGNNYTAASSALVVGGYVHPTASITADIGEIVILSRVLSAAEITQLDGYFRSYWGL